MLTHLSVRVGSRVIRSGQFFPRHRMTKAIELDELPWCRDIPTLSLQVGVPEAFCTESISICKSTGDVSTVRTHQTLRYW